jgi:hypothetical protein
MPAPVQALSNDALQQLRAQVDLALSAPPAAAPKIAAAPDFCSLWPEAKPILQAVGGIIAFIPGIGAGAGPIMNALISVGDQIYNTTCKK